MNQNILLKYTLDTKGANKLAHEIYKNLKEPGFVDKVLELFSLNLLVKTKNSGLISNILTWFISTGNNLMINQLISEVNQISNFKLMKRDYMNLVCYFYHTDYPKAQMYFETEIICKKTNANTSIIQTKDIDFILSNRLNKMLKYLSGLFICSSSNFANPIVQADGNFKKFTIKPELEKYLLEKITNSMESYSKTCEKFYAQNKKNYYAIIDAGNVLHGRKGKITSESIADLEQIIITTKKQIGEPLIVVHKKHIKSYEKLQEVFIRTNSTYFLTPYNFNDDIFIMWFFVKSGCSAYIISNDKYRDHIFTYQSSLKIYFKDNDASMCEFSNVIKEQTIGYQLEPCQIESPLVYSNCIQIIGNYAYVPHIFGGFVKVFVE